MNVVEKFYTIQGEGKYAGTPAIFIRLGGCNLWCGMLNHPSTGFNINKDARWVCDTVAVWMKKGEDISPQQLLDYILTFPHSHIVFTGGEPLLHKNELIEVLKSLNVKEKEAGKVRFVEFETNGTVPPIPPLFSNLDLSYNVSPKLANSGLALSVRYNKDVLKQFLNVSSIFKFVVNDELEVAEIENNYNFIPNHRIYLMPASSTREELIAKSEKVVEMCKKYNYIYSPRLQLFIYDRVVGV